MQPIDSAKRGPRELVMCDICQESSVCVRCEYDLRGSRRALDVSVWDEAECQHKESSHDEMNIGPHDIMY